MEIKPNSGSLGQLHLLWFTVVPLVASGIFYASNGANRISYIDCLFMTVSPMTMTGLETVLMASLTTWQQVLMFASILPLFIFLHSWGFSSHSSS